MDTQTKYKKNGHKVLIGVLVTLVVCLALLGGGYAAGFRVVSDESTKSSITYKSGDVCGDDVVSRYNNAVTAVAQDEQGHSVSDLVNDVKSKKDNQKDPNCVFILAEYYLDNSNVSDARDMINLLKTMDGKGSFASGAIVSLESTQHLTNRLNVLTGESGNSSGDKG